MLTERFLFTVHAAPCGPLQHARHQYRALDNEDARADRARVLFMILDILIGSISTGTTPCLCMARIATS